MDNNGAISCFGDLTAIINNYAGGIISNNSGGTINISGNANGQAAFNNSGTVNNNIGAIINNNNSAVFTNNSGGSVNNSGTINNNSPNPTHATIPPCSTIHTMNTNGGTIVNNANGTVTNSGTINDYCGSTFTNNGSLTGNPVVNKCVPTVTITSVSNTNPKWGVPVSVSGTATNFVSTDTISVDWGDGSSPTVISASASWGPVTHPYSAAAIATNPNNIVATLLSGTTVDATSASFPITVQKHDVTLTANAPDVKWSKDHALTGKLTDNDAGGAAIGSATIVPGGDDTFGAGPFTTAADGSYSATGTAPPGPAGPHSDTAKYLGDGSYNPAGPITANYNTLIHDVTLTLAPIANLKWSLAYSGT